jgi:hypothetical protein
MTELDDNPTSPVAEKTVEEAIKPMHRSIANLTEPNSETSSIAEVPTPDKEDKPRPPRKLMEDEKRAKGRIAKDIWATYFKVSPRETKLM